MKLSNLFAKLTSGKVNVLSTMGGLAMAGLVVTAAPAATAQVAFGVQVGGPQYYDQGPQPVYTAPGYGNYAGYGYGYDPQTYWQARRAQEWQEHQEHEWREHQEHQWHEHEEWEHRGGYGGYGGDGRFYGRGNWR